MNSVFWSKKVKTGSCIFVILLVINSICQKLLKIFFRIVFWER